LIVPWLLLGVFTAIVVVWRKLIPLRSLAAKFLPMAAVVETPAQARSEVRRQVKAGVDFVKPYDHLDRDTYFAILHAARQEGIYSAGHILDDPEIVGVREALEAGLNEVAHVDEFTHEFLVNYDPRVSGWVEWELATDRVDEIASLVAEYDAAVTATLVTGETVLLGLEDMEALLRRPEYAHIKAESVDNWKSGGRMVRWKGQEKYRRDHLRPLWMRLTIALHRAGVLVLVGTDSDVEGIVPGYSEHRELQLFVEAGMTPFEALSAATRNAALIAQRMNADSNWGTIEVGNRADLVLLSRNPLDDISNSKHILGVMVRGRWFSRDDLDQRVAEYRGNRL
jgi:imidazolonepropionase-like amidohydrolase